VGRGWAFFSFEVPGQQDSGSRLPDGGRGVGLDRLGPEKLGPGWWRGWRRRWAGMIPLTEMRMPALGGH